MGDLFPEELTQSQSDEIARLNAKVAELENTCKWLNMIYVSAWEITAKVCLDGELTLYGDEEVFGRLYSRVQAYDENKDLRYIFEHVEKDLTP